MRSFLRDTLNPILMTLLIGAVAYDHFAEPRSAAPTVSTVDGVKLGRAYAPTLAPALADAWVDAASALEAGKSVTESQEILQNSFKTARVQPFVEKVVPDFARVLPEGTEPRDPAHRAEVVKLWRDFARGLRGGR